MMYCELGLRRPICAPFYYSERLLFHIHWYVAKVEDGNYFFETKNFTGRGTMEPIPMKKLIGLNLDNPNIVFYFGKLGEAWFQNVVCQDK